VFALLANFVPGVLLALTRGQGRVAAISRSLRFKHGVGCLDSLDVRVWILGLFQLISFG